jgi:hypothetical protein
MERSLYLFVHDRRITNGRDTVLWEEVKEGLQLEDFNYETIFKRLKQRVIRLKIFLRKRLMQMPCWREWRRIMRFSSEW